MKKGRYQPPLIVSAIVFLGLVSFVSCITAEIKSTKKKDIKMEGKLCYGQGSQQAVYLGIAALISLSIAQMMGNVVFCRNQFCLGETRNSHGLLKRTKTSIAFLVISWASFGTAVILLSAATSMNKKQPIGRGWLDGECYIVKDGVYAASAVLVLITIAFTLTTTGGRMK